MIPFFTYRPSKTSEIIGQDASLAKLKYFFDNFKKGKGLFLYGPPGVGKTSSVYAFAKENGYEVLELNASDARAQSTLKDFLSKATGQMSLFATKKLILLDEVDGLSGTKDRGAASVVADFIKKSTFPIVVTGINISDKKFSPMKKVCGTVEFTSLDISSLVTIQKNICSLFDVSCVDSDLKVIARNCAGDARASLNDLFSFVVIKQSDLSDLEVRRQTENIADVLIRVFKSTDPSVAFGAFDLVNEDLDKIFLWVDENLPYEYLKSSDLSKAYDVLALADKFFGRIRRWQYYRYYVYCYLLLSVGVAISKDEKYPNKPNYKQPMRLLKYWQANMTYSKRKSVVEKLAFATKVSKKVALKDSFYYLLPALANNSALANELDLTDDEVSWLKSHSK